MDCEGDLEWNECGSPCDRTCEEPNPVCAEICSPRCECPIGQVVLNMYNDWEEPRCGEVYECDGGEIKLQTTKPCNSIIALNSTTVCFRPVLSW